jgi:hypothetical protein
MTPAEVFASIPVEATPGGMVESLRLYGHNDNKTGLPFSLAIRSG